MSLVPNYPPVYVDRELTDRQIAEELILYHGNPKAKANLSKDQALELRALELTAANAPKGFPTMEKLVLKLTTE